MRQMNRENFFAGTFHVFALLFYAGLFLTSIFITGVNRPDRRNEYIVLEHHSMWRLLLITAVFGLVIFLAGLLYDKLLYKCNRNFLLGGICVLALLLGLYWVGACGSAASADQGMVCAYANAFLDGDFHGFNKGQMLARLNHWLGLVTVLNALFRIFGYGNYMAFQYVNALMLPLIIFCGCQIIRKIYPDNGKAEYYYLLLSATCFPMYAYTAFVYGELTSTAMSLLAAWLLLSCLEKFSVPKMIGLALASGLAVQLRKNTLIILIAFGIVVMVRLIGRPSWKILVTGLSILAGVVLLHWTVWGLYRDYWDEEARAIPAILWVSMGLHETDGQHPGWYDHSPYVIFAQNGDSVEIATQEALESIGEHLDKFRRDPAYAWYFFTTKINSQWQAPMYQSIVLNNTIVRPQSRIAQMIYNEELLGKMIKLYMKAFQLYMYGSVLFYLVIHWKERMPIEKYVLLIAIFGGFLFSIIWEAKTRYILPYLLIMIPYFAMGLQDIDHFIKYRTRKSGLPPACS